MSNDSVLYVQGIPEGVTSAQIEKAVNGAAKDVSKVTFNERKRFAHVTFSSHEAAEKGLKTLKKATIGGQTLEFEWSKAKESNHQTASFDEASNSTVFIRGLSTSTTDDEVKTAFADYGEIERAFVVKDKTKTSKGTAIVEFKTRASAEKALELNETELDGQTITVELAKKGPRVSKGKSSSNGSSAKKPAQKRKAESEEEEEKPAKKAKASETPKTAAKNETPKKEAAAASASTKKETPKKEAAASPAKKETPKKAATPSKAKGKK